MAPGAAVHDVVDGAKVEDAFGLRGLECAVEIGGLQRFGEVEERAGDGGDAEGVSACDVARVEGAYSVDDQAGARPAPVSLHG